MPEEILLDTETWGSRELLEVIASRFFDLGSEGAYPNSWEVQGIDEREVGGQLLQLNMHSGPMGLIGSLEDSNPPVMTISRVPSGSSVMENYQHIVLWAAVEAFMALVGSLWVFEYEYGGESGVREISQSFLLFTLPMMLSFILATF